MFKKLFKKLFCPHKWKTHAKKEYQWDEWDSELVREVTISKTKEILICEECGKIKQMIY